MDAEFFRIEQHLQQQSQPKLLNESLQKWISRLKDPELDDIVQLHNRYRFDPDGITVDQRNKLKRSVNAWMKRHDCGTEKSI